MYAPPRLESAFLYGIVLASQGDSMTQEVIIFYILHPSRWGIRCKGCGQGAAQGHTTKCELGLEFRSAHIQLWAFLAPRPGPGVSAVQSYEEGEHLYLPSFLFAQCSSSFLLSTVIYSVTSTVLGFATQKLQNFQKLLILSFSLFTCIISMRYV